MTSGKLQCKSFMESFFFVLSLLEIYSMSTKKWWKKKCWNIDNHFNETLRAFTHNSSQSHKQYNHKLQNMLRRSEFQTVACRVPQGHTHTWAENYPAINIKFDPKTSNHLFINSFIMDNPNLFIMCQQIIRNFKHKDFKNLSAYKNNFSLECIIDQAIHINMTKALQVSTNNVQRLRIS